MQEISDLLLMLWPLLVFQLLLAAWAIIDLVRRKTVKALPKWAWALIVLLVNIFGPIIYLVFGRGEE
ncbi:MAG: PLD nuclease N-terminal domain-containing protein [Dethiobacteria bacterium]|nr:PLD nuclease N-terminal domain-containing protein [Bacillota bacterium]